MRLPILLLLVATPAFAAQPALIWSQQQPADENAVFVAQGLTGEPRALFSLPVAPGYVPLASLSPDGGQLVATTLPGGHPERDGLLWRVDLRSGVVRQIDSGVLYMERPIALAGGATLYMKVTDVLPALPERSRLGELDVVETEVRLLPNDGPALTLHTDRGYGLHFAAVAGDELVLYRVARDEAAFYALPLKGGELRRLAAAPTGPFARDFSLRGRTLVFAATRGGDTRASLYGLDLDRGTLRAIDVAENGYPAPLASANRLYYVAGAPGAERLVLAGKEPRVLLDGGIPFPLAAGDGLVAVRRQTAVAQELWLIETGVEGAKRRLPADGYFSVAGIGEAP